MPSLTFPDGSRIELDDEGYLSKLDDWNETVALTVAQREGINLSAAHWEIIHLVRDYYQQYDLSPAMRPLVKQVALTLGADKGRSIYLMQLFPQSTAKLVSKIAGLPKPTNCL